MRGCNENRDLCVVERVASGNLVRNESGVQRARGEEAEGYAAGAHAADLVRL